MERNSLLNNTADDTAVVNVHQNVGKADVSQIIDILKGLTFVDSPLVFSGKLQFIIIFNEELIDW